MTNSTQELHATDCSAQRKTTQISAKYANKYTQNMGLATAGGKNERKKHETFMMRIHVPSKKHDIPINGSEKTL